MRLQHYFCLLQADCKAKEFGSIGKAVHVLLSMDVKAGFQRNATHNAIRCVACVASVVIANMQRRTRE